MFPDLVPILNIFSTAVLGSLCLWVVWTHKIRTRVIEIAALFLVWLTLTIGLDSVVHNPRSLPIHATVVYFSLSVYGLRAFYRIEVQPWLEKHLGIRPRQRRKSARSRVS
jgi:hypothetical protein